MGKNKKSSLLKRRKESVKADIKKVTSNCKDFESMVDRISLYIIKYYNKKRA